MILISLHFPYYCSVLLNFPLSKVSENMLYVSHCVPFCSVLRTPLPRNKNRPDIRNRKLSLSDGTKLLRFKQRNLKYWIATQADITRSNQDYSNLFSYIPPTKMTNPLANEKRISTYSLSALKVNVHITAQRWINTIPRFPLDWIGPFQMAGRSSALQDYLSVC